MHKRRCLEENLFSWESWDENGPMSLQFYNVELKVAVGEFSIGHKFPVAFIMGEDSIIVFVDENDIEHSFALTLSVGDKLKGL